MIDIKHSVGRGFGTGGLYDILKELQLFSAGIQGEVYFVEGNTGDDGNDGSSWNKAYKTLAAAITASNASIANADMKGYASRNTIFVKGDRLVEDLDIFPNKCDVIGVGSCDAYIGAGIQGNHEPANAGNYGTRFININFFPKTTSEDIVILASTSSGIEFHNCTFIGVWGAITAPSAIDITASPMGKIENCKFLGAFSGDVIDIGAGDCSGLRIVDNTIIGGADNGIVETATATVAGAMSRGLIMNNFIQVADEIIKTQDVSVFNVIGNRGISAETTTDGWSIDETYAVDNVFNMAGAIDTIPNTPAI